MIGYIPGVSKDREASVFKVSQRNLSVDCFVLKMEAVAVLTILSPVDTTVSFRPKNYAS